jgi:hypothetical protein
MRNSNTPYSSLLISHKRVMLFTLIAIIVMSQAAKAQPLFTRTTFNDTYTPITIGGGATSSIATGDNANETGIPIGFSFDYNGIIYTTIGLSTNGVAWFDAIAPATTVGNTNMVTTSGPNQSLAPWFNNLIDDASSDILYQTQGSPGSMTFTLQYTNYPTYTGTPGSNVRMNCQIILYETTNVIEFRYGTLNVIGAQTTSGGAMIGIEWGTGGHNKFIDAVTGSSIVSNRMLSPLGDWPAYNFRFTPGAPSTVSSGTYDVGVGQTYNSLSQAVADVNHRGISGAVTLNLTDAQYDTTVANGSNRFPLFIATPNSSVINQLTISKTGASATLAYRGSNISASGAGYGTGVSTTALGHTSVPLMGVCASYTTISNVNLITHGTTPHQVEIGLAVFELLGSQGAQHNMFDKISVDLDRNQGGSYGIASFSTTSPGGFAGTNSYNTYRDISIKDCNFGLSLSAPNNATGPADEGNQIITSSCSTYNYIGDPNVPDDIISSSPSGILLNGQYNFTIRNCIIQNITATSMYSTNGIVVTNSFGSNEISNNIIRTIRRTASGLFSNHWISGIRINWPNQSMSFKIFNNSISNLLASYTGAPTTIWAVVGIFIESNTGTITTEIYNNSVSIDGSTFPNASSGCLSMNSVSKTSQIKNNVFANFTGAQTGVPYHTCFYTNAASQYGSAGSLSDYNNFYIADTSRGFIARATTTNFKTLADWQAAMTLNPGTDANSVVANPNFVNNATDLHPTASSTSLDGMGTTPPVYITTDLDCRPRTSPHDIGCYFAGCEAVGGTISPTSATACAKDVYELSSTGASDYPSAAFQWMVSETPGGPYTNVTGGSGANTTSYTTGKLKKGIFYYVLQVSCPDGGTVLSNEFALDVKGQPEAAITPEGPISVCKGTDVLLTATGGSNRSYQWLKKDDPIAGATGITYTAISAGKYQVVVTNTVTGCTNTSAAVKITEYEDPLAIITPQGPTTFCEGGSVVLQANTGAGLTYQWKKGSNFISGATQSAYTATEKGNYKVEVTDANGCTKLSEIVEVTVPCKLDGKMQTDFPVSIFPNPATDQVNIVLATTTADFEVELTNITGERMLLLKNENSISISHLAAGVYFIKISTADHAVIQKLVKQ